jgi:hypothetical protein
MVTQSGGAGARTYMPESEDLAKIVDLVAVLGARGIAVPEVITPRARAAHVRSRRCNPHRTLKRTQPLFRRVQHEREGAVRT